MLDVYVYVFMHVCMPVCLYLIITGEEVHCGLISGGIKTKISATKLYTQDSSLLKSSAMLPDKYLMVDVA